MILMVGIQGALQDDPLFDMPTDNREASIEILVSSQNDIGWSHLLSILGGAWLVQGLVVDLVF